MKIGVIRESLRLSDNKEALKCIRDMGASAVQFYLDPELHSQDDVLSWRDDLEECGLVAAATCIDFGGFGLTNPHEQNDLLRKIERAIRLSKLLGADVATTHIGVIPDHPHPRRSLFLDSLRRIETICEALSMNFAIETGPEPSRVLRDFLLELDAPHVGVNFDPANLFMTFAEETTSALDHLYPFIRHIHAKDGVFIKQADPEAMYQTWGTTATPLGDEAEYCLEVPLGEGGVDFDALIETLIRRDYQGFVTIERETGDEPLEDIRAAIRYLERKEQEIHERTKSQD